MDQAAVLEPGRTRPLSYAKITAWTRSRSRSFIRIRFTCVLTVDSSPISSLGLVRCWLLRRRDVV